MVMKLHTGVPGAGKSYLLIKSFTDAFCVWDKDLNEWQIKPQAKRVRLISNIEGLTLEHENLDVLISERCQALARRRVLEEVQGSEKEPDELLNDMNDIAHEYYLEYMQERTRWFFNDAYQQSLAVDCSLIYLIEESQRYFDTAELGRKPWVRDVLYFFERHRHHGVSMFMDTQHSQKLHRGIVALFEEEIRAKPRTLSVMGEFRYNSFSDGLKTNQVPIVVRPDKRIFAAYQSMSAMEAVKPKKPFAKIAVFLCVAFGLAFGMYKFTLHKIGPAEAAASEMPKVHSVPDRGPGGKNVVPDAGEWVRVSHVMRENGEVWIIHPVYGSIMPLSDFDLEVKVSGTSLFSWVETEKK